VKPDERLENIAEALSIPRVERHIFLCAGQSNPKCAAREITDELWRHLKSRLKETNLASAPPRWQGEMEVDPDWVEPGTGKVLRSKVDCLRICEQGAIALVYPEGTWYAGLDADKLDRIIDEHLVGGQPVDELSFTTGDLKP
jgi:(2Fe-2S) ferredoxin